MRLSKLKIAGFKSFVDPTIIDMRSNLTGIVGPNGCGKSNTIDAVRWVMGESSAKHLRGASMDDVIFNGSSSRKPIGQASIALLFDNSDASLGGEFAKYSEIEIKRQIHRDGQSKYFLNGSRCRRRDITDIFMGTGLGPRSYAIIEQGTISRLIEAKPEELRTTIEEVAGISKYKERRRETETRIRHTRENLERLSDLREEMDKQITHLKRQAKSAEKFKTLKASERQLSAELIILRLQKVETSIRKNQKNLDEKATLHQAKLAKQRSLENKIESKRKDHSDANTALNKTQGDYYQTGAEISRLEQTIKHQKTLNERHQKELQQFEEELLSVNKHLKEDKDQLQQFEEDLAPLAPKKELIQTEIRQTKELLEDAETHLSIWQQSWRALQNNMRSPTQQIHVESARIEQLESSLQKTAIRLDSLKNEREGLSQQSSSDELSTQEKQLVSIKEKHQITKETFVKQNELVQEIRNGNKALQQVLQSKHSQLQSLKGKLSSLEVLQEAGLNQESGQSAKKLKHWLTQHNLQENTLLAERIQVEEGWEKALETVLGDLIESRQIQSYDQLQTLIQNAPDISVSVMVDSAPADLQNTTAIKYSLASKLSSPPYLKPLLSHVLCADTLDAGLALQKTLEAHQTIVIKNGALLGKNWLTLQATEKSNHREGILARQKEIKHTRHEIDKLTQAISESEKSKDKSLNRLEQKEEELAQQQAQLNALHRNESQLHSVIYAIRNKRKQVVANQERIQKELENLVKQKKSERSALEHAINTKNNATLSLESLEKEKLTLKGKDIPLQEAVHKLRQQMQKNRSAIQQNQLLTERLKTKIASNQKQLNRFDAQLSQLEERKKNLIQQNISTKPEDIEALQNKLNAQLEQHKTLERSLTDARNNLQAIENEVRALETDKHQAEQDVEKYRTDLEKLKLKWNELSVHKENHIEQFNETEFDLADLENSLNENTTLRSHQEALEQVQRKVARLGAINLAAIDEFKVQTERKEYLDQQNTDLVEALETLESAIAKIDKDTRSLFKDTFTQVNNRIQEMFPQLFGGGKAHLELTGDDLLTTGISIMAQPPGKKLSNIHLMSGGEKALTAIALVFAIFELNPAPFCMLDEVDAPLDEANVGRFCSLVKKMSDHVQFIFITHNKTTMELADNLIGVTMREAGVSRLVSVDVNEATLMTQEVI